jgi:hypothetical protein
LLLSCNVTWTCSWLAESKRV